jgi:hypothetical protein
MRQATKPTHEERINVRVPADLMRSIEEAAKKSGWGVSDQIRFELMQLRGMWKTPYLPTKPVKEIPVGA